MSGTGIFIVLYHKVYAVRVVHECRSTKSFFNLLNTYALYSFDELINWPVLVDCAFC